MTAVSDAWKFYRFGLLVTGKGEAEFAHTFFRSLMESGRCSFEVIRRIGQRSPITSEKRKLRMVGTGKTIPDRDANEIGLPARRYLQQSETFVILLDDLEADRQPIHADVFARYRESLDALLPPAMRTRAAVHFFVVMIEAYYFADADAINDALGTVLSDYDGDVEAIPHPKNELKRLAPGFDEMTDGAKIVRKLDLRHVLSNPDTCASLRSLFKWCATAIQLPQSDEFQLVDGLYCPITGSQIDSR